MTSGDHSALSALSRDHDSLRTSLAIASSASGHHRPVRDILSVHHPGDRNLHRRSEPRGNPPACSTRLGACWGLDPVRVAPLVRSSRPAANTNPSHEQVSSSSPHLLPSARDHAGGETAAAPHPRLRRCRQRGGDRPRSPRPRHPRQPQREVRRKTRRSPGTLATSVGEDRATA